MKDIQKIVIFYVKNRKKCKMITMVLTEIPNVFILNS